MLSAITNAVRSSAEMLGYFAKAVHLYGPIRAAWLFARLYSPFRKKGKLFAVSLPDYLAPIWLRSGTTDVPTFLQTLIDRQYGFHGFAQQSAVQARYDNLVARGKHPLIIDCGANVGLSAVWFAKTFTAARIYAVEPEAGNFEVLRRNASYYSFVTALRGGIWDRETTLSIADSSVDPWEYQVQEAPGTPPDAAVPTLTMNGIRQIAAEQNGIDDGIFIAKIDIEGAEEYLFRSNTEWVADCDVLIMELHDWMIPGEGSSNSFFRSLATLPAFDYLTRNENIFIVRAPQQDAVASAGVGHRDYRRSTAA